MALDRQSIERRDFPVGRRGYDPDAVDAHLSTLADEVAELRRASRNRGDTLASSASDQVRAIIEAAETSASDIRSEAEADAREIRDEADAEARATRQSATDQARAHIGGVSDSAEAMLSRLNAMQTELDALIGALRAGAGRMNSELHSLQSELGGARGVISPRGAFQPDAPGPGGDAGAGIAGEADADPELLLTDPELLDASPEDGLVAGETSPGEEPLLDPEAEMLLGGDDDAPPAAVPGVHTSADVEGARLIALNMALDGTPRDQTARYLDENFAIGDAAALLDEVYASVEG